jgi:hypothetical protein
MKLRGVDDVNDLLSRVAPNHAQNIMRATVHDMAREVAKDARGEMPSDEGDLKRSTKHKREKVRDGKVQSTVRVNRRAFYWRFLEYGQGPDGVEYAFFAKAVQKLRAAWTERFLRSFVKKFESTLARARRRQAR